MAIEKIRLTDGTEINLEEWLHWPIFSTGLGAVNGANELRLFEYVVGDRIPTMGVVAPATVAGQTDTNQVVRGRINHDEGFVMFSMFPEFFALDCDPPFAEPAADNITAPEPVLSGINIRRMQRYMNVELIVGAGITKPQASAPLEYFCQGVGAVAFGSGDGISGSGCTPAGNVNNIALDYGTAGRLTPDNVRRQRLPVKIDANRDMYVSLSVPNGSIVGLDQPWRMRWWLDGIKRRPVA